jgi:Protein of unknown function (DUF3168)
MSMEEALVAFLLSVPGVAALVGSRIHWVRLPQGLDTPHVRLTVISGGLTYNYSGADSVQGMRVQMDCFGDTYASAKSVGRAVEAALSGFRGVMGSRFVDGAFLVAARDLLFEDDTTADGHAVSMDFNIFHKSI